MKYLWYKIRKSRSEGLVNVVIDHNRVGPGIVFPTVRCVRPARPQIILCLCAVWSEPLLVA